MAKNIQTTAQLHSFHTSTSLVAQRVKCLPTMPGSIPGLKDLLEKEMETHFSILAWKIPRTEEPGRL